MKTEKLVMICLMCIASFAIQAQKVIKIGIIGLDTSHSPAFIGLLNSEDPKPEHERIQSCCRALILMDRKL